MTDRRVLRQAARVEARSRGMARALAQWFGRAVQSQQTAALRGPGRFAKAITDRQREELRQIILRFGVRQLSDGARRAAGRAVIPRTLLDDALAGKEINLAFADEWLARIDGKVSQIEQAALDEAKRLVRDVLREAERETKDTGQRPSAAEVARRLRRDFQDSDKITGVSFERSMLIARTELAQVENSAIATGLDALGVKRVRWLAFSDGRSGDRHHERLDGLEYTLGEKIRTPLGNRVRYPADPAAPIAETANCRCTIVAA